VPYWLCARQRLTVFATRQVPSGSRHLTFPTFPPPAPVTHVPANQADTLKKLWPVWRKLGRRGGMWNHFTASLFLIRARSPEVGEECTCLTGGGGVRKPQKKRKRVRCIVVLPLVLLTSGTLGRAIGIPAIQRSSSAVPD